MYKKSKVIGEWRWRFAWIAANGNLYFAADDLAGIRQHTMMVPLTAGATYMTLTGRGSRKSWDHACVLTDKVAGLECSSPRALCDCRPMEEGVCSDAGAASPTGSRAARIAFPAVRSPCGRRRPDKAWGVLLETAAVAGICPVQAASAQLRFESSEARDAFVDEVVAAVERAGQACFRMQEPVPPEDFAAEVFMAHGAMDDHSLLRYASALHAVCQLAAAPGGADQQQEAAGSPATARRDRPRAPWLACGPCFQYLSERRRPKRAGA